MPNRGDRGGSLTRARIADEATRLFLDRGFDEVTIADVAAAAGVSKVTVFNHFERKEDLLLDQLPEAVDMVRDAVRDRHPSTSPVAALRQAALELAKQRHPLSGLSDGGVPFMRLFLASPALVARMRVFQAEVESALAEELVADSAFAGDPRLAAALLVAAYRSAATATIEGRLSGLDLDRVAVAHRRRLRHAFGVVERGLAQ